MRPKIKALSSKALVGVLVLLLQCCLSLQEGTPPIVMKHLEGCFLDDAGSPVFASFPSATINPGEEGTASGCWDACARSDYKHAGLLDDGTCFCAGTKPSGMDSRSICGPCENAKSETCGGPGGYVAVYQTSENKVRHMEVKISPGPYNMLQNVEVGYKQIYESVDVRVCYGESNEWTIWHIGKTQLLEPHTYSSPGTYDLLVEGRDTEFEEYTAERDGDVTILTPILNKPIIDCPETATTNKEITCDVTIVVGEDVTVDVDFGDGLPPESVEASDTQIAYVGIPIPQAIPEGRNNTLPPQQVIFSAPGATTIILKKTVTQKGYLIFFEALASTAGDLDMTFVILTPVCDSGRSMCDETGTCEVTCPPECEGGIDLNTGTCASSGGASGAGTKYTIRNTHTATATDVVGTPKNKWRLVRSSPQEVMEVIPGDVIGFSGATQVYCITPVDSSSADMRYDANSKLATPDTVNYFVGAVVSAPVELDIDHVYMEGNTYQVTAKLHSPTTNTSSENETSILVDSNIEGLTVQPEEEYSVANVAMYFTTSYDAGSDSNVTINYGDGSVIEYVRATKKALVVLQHTYGYPGIYNVSVVANTALYSATNSCLVYIQRPVVIETWTMMLAEPKVAFPPGDATVNLIFDNTTDFLPSQATAVFIWENGIVDPKTVFIDHQDQPTPATTALPFTQMHTYMAVGSYEILVNISNFVSSITMNKTVIVMQAIEGLKVSLSYFIIPKDMQTGDKYSRSAIDTFLMKGKGPDENRFPKDIILVYTISHEKGSIDACELQWTNGTAVEYISNDFVRPVIDAHFRITAKYLVRLYREPEKYEQVVVCKNDVSNASFPVPFNIMNGLDSLNISDFKAITNISKPMEFNVSGEVTEEDVCLRIEFDDSCQAQSFGNPTLCKKTFPDSQYNGSYMLTQRFSHVYNDTNNYTIKVTANDGEESVTKNITFQMLFLACDPPPKAKLMTTSVKNENMDPKRPAVTERSKSYKILSEMGLDACTMPIKVERRWRIVKVKEDGITEIHPVIIKEDLPSWNLSALNIPALFLDIGLYKINYTASVTPVRIDRKTKKLDKIGPSFTTSSFIYLSIRKSELVPIMIDGSMTSLQRGRGQTVHFKPAELSIDPDAPEKHDFNITWACITGKFGSPQVRPDWKSKPVKILTKQQQNYDNTKGGGCFGTGNGLLDMYNGSWNLSTGDLLPGNNFTIYNIWIMIRKDDRNASVFVRLWITEPKPPAIRIKCRDEGLCFPTSEGILINPTFRLAMSSNCLEDCCDVNYNQFKFNWSVSYADKVRPLHSDHIIGITYHEIAIFPEFFALNNATERFRFSLYATCGAVKDNPENRPGFAAIMVTLNKPPESSTDCTIEDTNDYEDVALKSTYRITCAGWSDPEGSPIALYKFYATLSDKFTQRPNENSDWQIILCNSRIPFCDVVLPCGAVELYVSVEDSMRANTTRFIANKTLIAPDDIKNYTQSSEWLETLKANGNQFAMLQRFQALSSIQECSDAHAGDADDQISTMKRFLDSMKEINLDSYEDALLYTSSLGSFLMDGDVIDSDAKETIVGLLAKVDKCMRANVDDIPLEPLKELTKNTAEIMGVLAGVGTKTIMERKVLPTDERAAETMDYEADIGDRCRGLSVVHITIEYGQGTDKSMWFFNIPAHAGYIPNINEALTMEQLYTQAIIDKEKRQTLRQLELLDRMLEDMSRRIINLMVVDEPPVSFDSPLTSSIYTKFRYSNTTPLLQLKFSETEFAVQDIKQLLRDTGIRDNQPIAFAAMEWSYILKSTGKHLSLVSPDTKSVRIDMYNSTTSHDVSKMSVREVKKPFEILIPQRKNFATKFPTNHNGTQPTVNYTKPRMKWYEQMAYHQINITKTGAAMIIEIILQPNETETKLLLYVRYKKKPLIDHYDSFFKLYDMAIKNNSYNVFLDTKLLKGKAGTYYVGVAQLNESKGLPSENVTRDMLQNVTIAYKANLIATGCYFYDDYLADWRGQGCWVHGATEFGTECRCTHLTSFAGGLMVVPNKIDFSYVFANASFADNLTIYATIILTLVIFVIFLIWARRKDNRDHVKIGALPLPDNQPQAKYLYEILVFTGHARTASCDSKVSFVLSGDKEETEVRTFGTPPRKVFRRDGVDVFIMATPRPLGQLQYVRIWHDSSGKGTFGSWQLDYILFRDVQTGEKFEFIANCWLGLEKEDGETDRVLPVAGKEQLTEFNHLFNTSSRKNLADGHLWFSIFLRPPRSRFTRCQRVCSCMTLLYLSMLVNAMWYGTVPEKPSGDAIKMGPLNISLEQVSVAFFSNLIVFPPSFLVIFLFRKSRPRKLRPSRVDEALKKQREAFEASKTKSSSKKKKSQAEKDRKNQLYQRKKRFSLPWWCVIIAWILCIACILLAIFFLWAYGITFGNSKTKKWITSLIISFFLSIFFIQPIKVFFLAVVFSSLCKKIETDEDDADEDELDPNLEYDEEWAQADPTNPKKIPIKPKDPAEVEALRFKRLQEAKLWQITREIVGYLIFLWILSIVTVSVRDPNAFHLRNGILDEFVNLGRRPDFTQINDFEHFHRWMKHIMIPRLRPGTFYNGKTRIGWVGYTEFGVNRIMGKAILRQVRARSDGHCQFNHVMDVYNISCRRTHTTKMTMEEDDQNYTAFWIPLRGRIPHGKNRLNYLDTIKPFVYSTSEEYRTTMLIGNLDMYSGNGYVFELKDIDLVRRYENLTDMNWIDNLTRAVIIEFSVYNAQVDLFCIIKLLVEVGPGGGLQPYMRINPVRLLSTSQGLGNLYLICQLIFVVYIIYYTFRELFHMCSKGRKYFKEFWSTMELLVVLMAWSAIGMYIARFFILRNVMKEARKTQFIQPVDLPYAQTIDEFFSYLIAATMFLSIIKINKLLRFNNRLTMLAQTVAQSMNDLGGFFVLLVIIFIAFATLFHFAFKDIIDCRTMYGSLTTLFSISLNKFEFDEFLKAQPTVGPIIFFTFAFLFTIVIMNVFLSILIGSFERVKSDVKRRPLELHMMEFVFGRVKGMFGVGSRKRVKPKNKAKEAEKEEVNGATAELPQKVDRLLDYINDIYFEGKLNIKDKKLLRGHKLGILKSD